jgi:hypothetical protein
MAMMQQLDRTFQSLIVWAKKRFTMLRGIRLTLEF